MINMKIAYRILYRILIVFSFPLIAIGQNIESKIQKLFPKPDRNDKKVYINLPQLDNETQYMVEVYVGREVIASCDSLVLKGDVEVSNQEGFYFPFYKLKLDSLNLGAQMICIESDKKKFIHVTPKYIKYNSQFPLVFYIPYDFIVRYKVYNSNNALYTAAKMNDVEVFSAQQYHFLENYYPKKGAQSPITNYIENEKELESVYWFSKTNYNIPTQVNFDYEFVVPILFEDSYYQNKIEIVSIEKDMNGFIQILYKIRYGKPSSYPIYPSVGIVFNNKLKSRVFIRRVF